MRRKLKTEDRRQKTENRSQKSEAHPERSRADRIQHRVSSIEYLGFTLTEVVIASALLIIAMVPILKALTSAHASGTIIEHKTRSLMLAQAKLDDIKARSIYNYSSSFTEANTSLDGSYLCTVTDSGPSTDLRTVAVAVGYDLDGSSTLETAERQVTLTTLVARRW